MVGRYWTKLYVKSKPWAEIRDESCLAQGCHDKRLLEGQVKFKKTVFDHKIHFEDLKRGKKLQCTSCHSQIVQGEHITVTESSCFICHFKVSEHYPRISDCSHCHTKEDLISEETSKYNHSFVFDKGFNCNKCHSDVVMGDGAVPRENCYKCHWERERLDEFENTDLMHSTHIYTKKIECNQCHMEIQHKIIKDIETIADCQACHTDYHEAQKILFLGEGGKGISHPMPNIMLEKGLSCKGCHIFHEETGGKALKSETFISRAQACESCHGKGFARIMRDWEISTDKKLRAIRSIYRKVNQELSQKKCAQEKECQTLLTEAAFNIDIVERGKGVHNIEYSQELLSSSYNKLLEALKIMDSSYKPEYFLATAKEIPTQCSNCHSGIEEINKQIYGLDFPHKNHLIEQKIQCDACHSNVRKHGEFTATKQSCAVCHHKDPEIDCTTCHQIQRTFYEGGNIDQREIPQDIMSEAEVECLDCHQNDKAQIDRSDKSKCMDCHEEEYEEIFVEWQNSIKELTQSIQLSLKEKKKLPLTQEQKAQISNIEKIVRNIKLDGSYGIHNFAAMEEILTRSQQTLNSLNSE